MTSDGPAGRDAPEPGRPLRHPPSESLLDGPGATPRPPTRATPDGRWRWDGEEWIELRPDRRWPRALRRPRRAWLTSITTLWILTWWQPYLGATEGSGRRVAVGLATFAVACAVTVAFGGLLATPGRAPLRTRAATSGVVVLGIASIAAIGVDAAGSGGIGQLVPTIVATILFGSVVIVASGAVGFVLLRCLLWIGTALATRRSACARHR